MEAVTETVTAPCSIPIGDHAGYPRFLSGSSGEDGVLLNDPLASLRLLRPLDRFSSDHRTLLADAVADQLHRWNAPQSALHAAELLRSPRSYAVVTGQQAGIAGGPLYTLYKALGTVRAAGELARLYPEYQFVPVFWIEGDDHDFDEARRMTLLDRSGNPATLLYDDGNAAPLHVGDRPNSAEGVATFAARVQDSLPSTEFTEDTLRLLRDSYRVGGGETLADGFARSLYAMLGDTALVLVNSRDSVLKGLAADIFEKEAADPEPLFAALQMRTTELAAQGDAVPIAPKPGALFITHDGERRALVPDGDGYLVRGSDRRLSRADVVRQARTAPERMSPNVALRPIVQDAVLPTALYLGGPSEVAYLRQVRSAYTIFGLEPPALMPRPFAVILEPKVRRVLEVAPIALEDLLAAEFDAAARVVDQSVLDEVEEARQRAMQGMRDAYAEMESITKRVDPTLEKTLGAAAATATKGLEDLAKRLGSALKKKQQTEIDRLNGARMMLMPGGMVQERTLNALYFINKYGVDRFRDMLDRIVLEPGAVQVLEI